MLFFNGTPSGNCRHILKLIFQIKLKPFYKISSFNMTHNMYVCTNTYTHTYVCIYTTYTLHCTVILAIDNINKKEKKSY